MGILAACSAVAGSALQRFSVRHGSKGESVDAEMMFTIRVEPDELDGGFVAECLELPGCMSQGETEQEALSNIVEAMTAVLEIRLQDHLSASSASPSLKPSANGRIHKISVA